MELHTVYWCLPCGGCAPKGVPVPTGCDTQEKSAVRESLIRWKTVRFSIEGRVIAHSVFMLDYSSDAKLGNSFNHAKQHSDNSCVRVSSIPILSDRHLY